MNARTAVAAFAAGVATVFAAAYGVGSAVGTVGTAPAAHAADHEAEQTDGHEPSHGEHEQTPTGTAEPELPGGLMVTQHGYTLDLHRDSVSPGPDEAVEFSITGPDGDPVTDYDVEHEKELHLIAVRRDFSGFQHVHPVMDDSGAWSVPVNLHAGQWRLFADFTPAGGQAITLGADLLVAGRASIRPDASETRVARVGDYEVSLNGHLEAGTDSELTLSVSRQGKPVTDLEPYLGAYGHVVALREGDLAYLHVHPDGTPGDGRTTPGPDVVFYTAVPSDGDFHIYLDFKHDGVVRTAQFKLHAGESLERVPNQVPDRPEDDEHDSADGEAHSH